MLRDTSFGLTRNPKPETFNKCKSVILIGDNKPIPQFSIYLSWKYFRQTTLLRNMLVMWL